MIKLIVGIILLVLLMNYNGVSSYKNVETLSDLGSLVNVYLSLMTAIILITFGWDDIIYKR